MSPPDSPIGSGPADSDIWREVEFRLGLDLPADFKQVLETYGNGTWGSCLWLLNPFSRDPDLNLERRAHDLLAWDHERQRRFPDEIPFALYPERHGLFPWAITSINQLYWLTEGPVDSWPTLVFETRGVLYDRHQGPATDFLFRFINGALPSRVMGQLEPEFWRTFDQASDTAAKPPSGALPRLDLT